ncbi:MAG: AAA family ATPase [Eubacteriales bacterium]|nr:AAA family ATPase [Eubacteriales bacterium]
MPDNNILSALACVPVAALTYQQWISVGMALKAEGFDCFIWDSWSRNDIRYQAGECERKWRSFRGNNNPITGATIFKMAKEHGWNSKANLVMGWDDEINNDEDDLTGISAADKWNPVQELKTYLELLFTPKDHVGYVTNDAWQDADGKWHPTQGVFDRTAGELMQSLEKYPDDLGATIGDWKPDAGAWIRFNPLDGCGVQNNNVTQYRYALVESDTMSISAQEEAYRRMELPIVCLVHSGGKSLHAIVRVDAADDQEYRERVKFLYDYLQKHGVSIDRQNSNPSRLSRLPGVTRRGNRQYIVDTNLGRTSWEDWVEFVEGNSDDLPEMVSLDQYKDNPPQLPEELIEGILRCGHKMLIAGSSKAGKSFLLMELCIAIAEGKEWLGFPCKKGRVLYVNLEIDSASCIDRFLRIYDALQYQKKYMEDIVIWNLRGYAVPLDKLVPQLVRRAENKGFDAIVIDPIYKVITGDENSASDMAAFCNQFDRICTETGCSAIYCHHHSKGAQGGKRAMDRASGSGVFARDPDAQLDMIRLELSNDMKNNLEDDNTTAWRLESNLREFPNIQPKNFWYEYPIHRVDTAGELDSAHPEGSRQANLSKSSKRTSASDRAASIDNAYQILSAVPPVTVKNLAERLGITEKTVRNRIAEQSDRYWIRSGVVGKKAEK